MNEKTEDKKGVFPKPPRDLPEFHLRWSEFRPIAVRMVSSAEQNTAEKITMQWLIAMADRIGLDDLN